MSAFSQILGTGLVCIAVCGTAGAHRDRHGHGDDRDRIEGSGDRISQVRDVAGFDEIRVECAFDLEITVGPAFSVELTYDDNLIDLIRTDVRGGVLVLDCEEAFEADRSCRARIAMPALVGITVNGAADSEVRGLSGGAFEYKLRGAGQLELQGAVERLDIHLLGAGSIDAHDLIAEAVDVQLSGTGSVRVHATQRFDGQVSGCGSITYTGNPPRAREDVSGIGSIRRR